MTDETTEVKIARLEEKLDASDKALALAQRAVELAHKNNHTVLSEVMAIVAILVSVFAVVHR